MPMIMRDLPQTKKPETAEFRFRGDGGRRAPWLRTQVDRRSKSGGSPVMLRLQAGREGSTTGIDFAMLLAGRVRSLRNQPRVRISWRDGCFVNLDSLPCRTGAVDAAPSASRDHRSRLQQLPCRMRRPTAPSPRPASPRPPVRRASSDARDRRDRAGSRS